MGVIKIVSRAILVAGMAMLVPDRRPQAGVDVELRDKAGRLAQSGQLGGKLRGRSNEGPVRGDFERTSRASIGWGVGDGGQGQEAVDVGCIAANKLDVPLLVREVPLARPHAIGGVLQVFCRVSVPQAGSDLLPALVVQDRRSAAFDVLFPARKPVVEYEFHVG